MKQILSFGLCLAVACTALAGETSKSALKGVRAPEVPAKAAGLVKGAKNRDKQSVTTQVVTEAVAMNPAAAPVTVGAVAKANPEMAAQAAATAAAAQPGQAAAIAKAAASAAPEQAAKIVEAMCLAVPNSFREIAAAVCKAAPGSEKNVLKAVAKALPQYKQDIDKSLAAYAGSGSAVASLEKISDKAATTTTISRGPSVGQPYVPISGTPRQTSPEKSSDLPPGGRDYTKP
jgi:hypothetical protein